MWRITSADAIQVVDADAAKLVRTIPLGGPKTPSLARRGEILFHDAGRSLQPVVQLQHLPQRRAHQRPGFRHAQRRPAGQQHVPPAEPQEGPHPPPGHPHQALDLARLADRASRTRWSSRSPRACKAPSRREEDVKALVAFLDTLDYPGIPSGSPMGASLRPPAVAEAVFRSAKAALQYLPRRPRAHRRQDPRRRTRRARRCLSRIQSPLAPRHLRQGPLSPRRPLQDPRDALKGPHSPESVTGLGELTEQELDDLIAYLTTL